MNVELSHEILPSGQERWYKGSVPHRDDGPAVLGPGKYEAYYQCGVRHRIDGPAIVTANGYIAYYQYGERHRDDGPALISTSGDQFWYCYGKRHRVDGPAFISHLGFIEYWVNGVYIASPEQFMSVTGTSKDDLLIMTLKYGRFPNENQT